MPYVNKAMSSGPTVIITGASSGIGLALAQAYARDEINLVLNALDEAKLARLAPQQRARGGIALVAGDIAQRDTAQRVIAAAVERFARVDVLVNNAGVFACRPLEQ